ncbi:MAG: PAS domain S-box protein [Oscillospiraceae bacterium]|nr:PAS domain S-box protein [Oscillospiraceae bacterium]
MQRDQIFRNSIIRDMSEGVMAIRFDGVIELINDSALTILGKENNDLEGKSLARAFFDDEENDAFIQCVLDAVYEKGIRRESYVPYRTAQGVRQLRVVSSCLREQGEMIGVILVISDITELTEMRDAVRAMETIQELNRRLELRNRLLQETFGRYLSDDVVREILASPEGWKLGGQRKTLTVLMSDLRGFTALSERMQAQDLITMLNHYFGEMYAEIERYRGTLIEFMGDGMLVVFGAPTWRETHAADAVAAAIGMQKRMDRVNRWNAEHGYDSLGMGIGINTDEMILGNIGSEKRTKYGVLGSAVNLAGRIESYTTAGQILISPGTHAAIREELEVRKALQVSPKGASGEIPLYDIVGIGAPYRLHINETAGQLRPLPQPAEVLFSLVEEKQIGTERIRGKLMAVSESGADLTSEKPLAPYANLCLDIGESLYAKVTESGEGIYRIAFTAKPPCFEAWTRRVFRASIEPDEGEDRHAYKQI